MSQPLDGFRSFFPTVTATDREFSGYVSEDDVKTLVLAIVESGYADLGKVCYVRGMGHQPRSVYSQMERLPGILVVNFESPLLRGLRFIPSFGGFLAGELTGGAVAAEGSTAVWSEQLPVGVQWGGGIATGDVFGSGNTSPGVFNFRLF